MNYVFRFLETIAAIVLGLGVLVGTGWSENESPQMIPGETAVTSGRLEYRSHCAQCHGVAGKGDGPVAAVLTKKPADLTVLAKNNGGTFPEEKVVNVINGSKIITAHGTRTMPIWSIEFSKPRPGAPSKSVTIVNERIRMLTDYLKSIQEK